MSSLPAAVEKIPSLTREITITRGRGYVSAERNKSEDLPIGVIAVDSIYTPIERVNMTVENTRVGKITDYDKLTLDIYTNGTLVPRRGRQPRGESAQRTSEPVY